MTTHQKGTKQYLFVFGWLALLTISEILGVMLGLPRLALVTFIVATAVAKALIIAMFFMHLKSENRWIWLVPGVPVALAFFFVLMLFPDMVYHLTLRLGIQP